MVKNDLTPLEKDLLKTLNIMNSTDYKYYQFSEWSNSEERIKENLRAGEIVYKIKGLFIAINPNAQKDN